MGAVQPRIAGSWRDMVFGSKVRIEGAWRFIKEVQTRVGGAWRDSFHVKMLYYYGDYENLWDDFGTATTTWEGDHVHLQGGSLNTTGGMETEDNYDIAWQYLWVEFACTENFRIRIQRSYEILDTSSSMNRELRGYEIDYSFEDNYQIDLASRGSGNEAKVYLVALTQHK